MEKYRVSKYLDQIKKVKDVKEDFASYIISNAFYVYFDTFIEAKRFVIGRHWSKILTLEKELKALHKKTCKLDKLTDNSLK